MELIMGVLQATDTNLTEIRSNESIVLRAIVADPRDGRDGGKQKRRGCPSYIRGH
jgi:hypothetical protein